MPIYLLQILWCSLAQMYFGLKVNTKLRPYEGPGDSKQRPYKPGRMDNDEELQVFFQSVRQVNKQDELCHHVVHLIHRTSAVASLPSVNHLVAFLHPCKSRHSPPRRGTIQVNDHIIFSHH